MQDLIVKNAFCKSAINNEGVRANIVEPNHELTVASAISSINLDGTK